MSPATRTTTATRSCSSRNPQSSIIHSTNQPTPNQPSNMPALINFAVRSLRGDIGHEGDARLWAEVGLVGSGRLPVMAVTQAGVLLHRWITNLPVDVLLQKPVAFYLVQGNLLYIINSDLIKQNWRSVSADTSGQTSAVGTSWQREWGKVW